MRITEQSRHALVALASLAERFPESMTIAALSEETGITEFNLFKLMKIVVRQRFVASTRGRGGGVSLARAPADISVGSVIRAVEPRFSNCAPALRIGGTLSMGSALAMRADAVIGQGLRAFLEELDQVPISAMIDKGNDQRRA